jgi:hypothetical protein
MVNIPTIIALLQMILTLMLILCENYSDSYTVAAPIKFLQRSIESPKMTMHRFSSKSPHDDTGSDESDDDVQLQHMNHPSLLTEDEVEVARQFKIVTCSASSCTAMRKKLLLDEYATFSLLYERLVQNELLQIMPIEETSCLGSCAMAPCVAIEHEDYDGTVALYGMSPSEFQLRTFHNVIHDDDAQRIWDILIASIRTMAQEDDTDTDYHMNDTDVDDNMDYDDNIENHPNAV